MQMLNPLLMQDWPIKKFLAAVLAVMVALWGLVALGTAGIDLPVLRPAIALVFLAFVPGAVTLRILRIHGLAAIEAATYSVSLSVAFVMFAGVLINGVYPYFGISRPVSLMPLMISFTVLISVGCAIAYARDRNFSAPAYVNARGLLSPPVLFLITLPLVSILGTQLVNFYDSNVLLMALIVLIAFTVLLIGFTRFIPENLYPLAVFAIGLSLLFYRTLISQYVAGYDIHEEYYVANLVKTAGVWDALSNGLIVNGLLSVTILAPVVSDIAGLELTWLFKAVYPLLFAIVPLGLYQIFRQQAGNSIAFLACFFFVGAFQFYTDLPVMLRQLIATIFVTCLTLLLINKRLDAVKRVWLFAIFGISVVVSHYGLALAYMILLIAAWLILVLASSSKVTELKDRLRTKFHLWETTDSNGRPATEPAPNSTINMVFCLLFVTCAFAWYMFIQDARVFESFATIGYNLVRNLSHFLDPSLSGGLALLLTGVDPSPLRYLNAAMNYMNQLLLVTGLTIFLLGLGKHGFTREYGAFSVISLFLIIAGVLVPFLTRQVSMDRLYHLLLIFLAPFLVISAYATVNMVGRLSKGSIRTAVPFGLVSIYLAAFFLFQTGFVWQLTDGFSGSVSISQSGFRKFGDNFAKAVRLYAGTTAEQDVLSAQWLSSRRQPAERIHATFNDGQIHTLQSYGMIFPSETSRLSVITRSIPENTYVFLQYFNIVDDLGSDFVAAKQHRVFTMTEVSHLFEKKNRIYANGGSEIYR